MSKYVLVFRNQTDRTTSESVEAEWGSWFGEIGLHVVDWGNRVGQATTLGDCGSDGNGIALSGYIVITADDLDAAGKIAQGCPASKHGGGVEIGEAVPV